MTWSLLGQCRSDMHPHLRSTPPQERCTPAVCRNTSSAAGEREEVNISGPHQPREGFPVSYLPPPGWRRRRRACGHWRRSSWGWCICPAWPGADTRLARGRQRSKPSPPAPPRPPPLEADFWVWCARGFGPSRLVFFSYHWEQQQFICIPHSKSPKILETLKHRQTQTTGVGP